MAPHATLSNTALSAQRTACTRQLFCCKDSVQSAALITCVTCEHGCGFTICCWPSSEVCELVQTLMYLHMASGVSQETESRVRQHMFDEFPAFWKLLTFDISVKHRREASRGASTKVLVNSPLAPLHTAKTDHTWSTRCKRTRESDPDPLVNKTTNAVRTLQVKEEDCGAEAYAWACQTVSDSCTHNPGNSSCSKDAAFSCCTSIRLPAVLRCLVSSQPSQGPPSRHYQECH